ncbi:MAG: hypothetical protein VX100_17185, partial [Pseudomonadota bacterium]|nr:hypothetical protein [Pseudomonadota bacterium]
RISSNNEKSALKRTVRQRLIGFSTVLSAGSHRITMPRSLCLVETQSNCCKNELERSTDPSNQALTTSLEPTLKAWIF